MVASFCHFRLQLDTFTCITHITWFFRLLADSFTGDDMFSRDDTFVL